MITFMPRLHAAAPGLAIFVPGHELAHAWRHGAAGSYSNVACMGPNGALAWEKQMTEDPMAAIAFGDRIIAFFDRYIAPLKARVTPTPPSTRRWQLSGGGRRWVPESAGRTRLSRTKS